MVSRLSPGHGRPRGHLRRLARCGLAAALLAACSDSAISTAASPTVVSSPASAATAPAPTTGMTTATSAAPTTSSPPSMDGATSITGAKAATAAASTTAPRATSTSTTAGPLTSGTPGSSPASVCGSSAAPPATYRHVVVVMEENRTWAKVGGTGFTRLPWLAGVAKGCAAYQDWTETNTAQNSLTQYIGLTSGVNNPATVNDCSPSATCRSTDDNIFRQVRTAGGTARTFVEGPTTGCSAAGNAAKHIPNLYYQGGDDPAACTTEVRPLGELDPDHLPTFAMIIPNLCHDGHDCSNTTVDNWLRDHLGPVLAGADYRAGTTAVFVLYDEDHPVPNLVIAPTATAGPLSLAGAGHRAALRTFEELLGLPLLPGVADAPSLRPTARI